MQDQTLSSWVAVALLALMTGLPLPVIALDTSTGVGLQDRALFQERVDYTLTNQSGGDFHGQNLINTSFAGATGRGADFSDANMQTRFSDFLAGIIINDVWGVVRSKILTLSFGEIHRLS